jgi:hypothetical protein
VPGAAVVASLTQSKKELKPLQAVEYAPRVQIEVPIVSAKTLEIGQSNRASVLGRRIFSRDMKIQLDGSLTHLIRAFYDQPGNASASSEAAPAGTFAHQIISATTIMYDSDSDDTWIRWGGLPAFKNFNNSMYDIFFGCLLVYFFVKMVSRVAIILLDQTPFKAVATVDNETKSADPVPETNHETNPTTCGQHWGTIFITTVGLGMIVLAVCLSTMSSGEALVPTVFLAVMVFLIPVTVSILPMLTYMVKVVYGTAADQNTSWARRALFISNVIVPFFMIICASFCLHLALNHTTLRNTGTILQDQLMVSLCANAAVSLAVLAIAESGNIVLQPQYAEAEMIAFIPAKPMPNDPADRPTAGAVFAGFLCKSARDHMLLSTAVFLTLEAAFFGGADDGVAHTRFIGVLFLIETRQIGVFCAGMCQVEPMHTKWPRAFLASLDPLSGLIGACMILASKQPSKPSMVWVMETEGHEYYMGPIYWLWAQTFALLFVVCGSFFYTYDSTQMYTLQRGDFGCFSALTIMWTECKKPSPPPVDDHTGSHQTANPNPGSSQFGRVTFANGPMHVHAVRTGVSRPVARSGTHR